MNRQFNYRFKTHFPAKHVEKHSAKPCMLYIKYIPLYQDGAAQLNVSSQLNFTHP